MPGRTNSTNNFGPTSFVVGETLGAGVNYTSIQDAVTDAFAAGGSVVLVRHKNSAYVGNITLQPGVDIIGVECQSSGVSSGGGSYGRVVIEGTLTAPVGGDCRLENLFISGLAAYAIDLVGAGSTVWAEDCTFTSNTNFAIHAQDSDIKMNRCNVSSSNSSAVFYEIGSATVRMFDCRVDSNNSCFDIQNPASLFCDTCILVSSNGNIVFDNAGGNIEFSRSQLIANGGSCIDMQVGGTCVLNYNSLTSINPLINFAAGGPVVRSYQNSFIVTGGGVNYVAGPGQYEYCSDAVNPLTAAGIDPATVQIKFGWRPWAETDVAPGASSVRGVASFDSSQFTVTDGFVQASGSIPITFTEDAGSATPVASVLNVLGGTGIDTSGAGNTITVAVEGSVATNYNADVGSAVPVGNTLQILTGSHIGTTGAGNTITINVAGSVPTDWVMDGATTAQSVGGQMNLVGGAGIRTSGNGSNTITINGITYVDTAVNVTAQDDEGYFATGGGAVTITTQAGAAQGASLGVVRVGATTLVVDAQPGQFIQIGNSISTSGGLATSSDDGDALTLVFRSTGSIWFATSVIGNWTLS